MNKLSNWHVRLSRRRFWKGAYNSEKIKNVTPIMRAFISPKTIGIVFNLELSNGKSLISNGMVIAKTKRNRKDTILSFANLKRIKRKGIKSLN